MKWIKIEDELPERLTNVITAIIDPDGEIDEVKRNWIVRDNGKKANGKSMYYDRWAQGTVTHWIPMPKI